MTPINPDASPLAAALSDARPDVLDHAAAVESFFGEGSCGEMKPPAGSVGAYLLDLSLLHI